MAKEFASMWVTIKQDYKDATNSKKPAEKRFWVVQHSFCKSGWGLPEASVAS